jgi:16S rRNA (cytidine1402-2'-O)-methyltransferase
LIAAEDTRHTGELLAHFGIETRMISYFEHNKLQKLDQIMAELDRGDVALVSDAGTPGLNDPGYELVRAALKAGHRVSPIPGPSAPIAALVASGLPTDAFLYLGYLPRKATRRRELLKDIGRMPYTLVFLETPHRLSAALQDLHETLGDREISIARELTKLHEEIFHGKVTAAREHFEANTPRGEFTLVLAGYSTEHQVWSEESLRQYLLERIQSDGPASQLARQAAAQSGWPRRKIYNIILALQEEQEQRRKHD